MTDAAEKRLQRILRNLSPEQIATLLEFAEFLAQRTPAGDTPPAAPAKPLEIPRPHDETVVKAVKRLRATYPMLDARALLSPTSELVTQHLLHGRPAVEVIDELEILFRSHFERLSAGEQAG